MVVAEVASSTILVIGRIPSQHMSIPVLYRRPPSEEVVHLRPVASPTGIPLRLQDTTDHLLVQTVITMDPHRQSLVEHTTIGQQMAITTKFMLINTPTGPMEATTGILDSVNHITSMRRVLRRE